MSKTVNTSATIIKAMTNRAALNASIDKGDVNFVKRYFKMVNTISIIGAIFMALICILVAVSMLLMTLEHNSISKRHIINIPSKTGQPPITEVIDETGYINDYNIEAISNYLKNIANDYHIQVAVYSSFEPSSNVYDQFFEDENGVVIYIEEHESYGVLNYYWGDNLNYIFTEENIDIINEKQTYLSNFTHDRAVSVVNDFESGLNALINSPSNYEENIKFEILTVIFWLFMAPVFFFGFKYACMKLLGVPFSKNKREEILKRTQENMVKVSTN